MFWTRKFEKSRILAKKHGNTQFKNGRQSPLDKSLKILKNKTVPTDLGSRKVCKQKRRNVEKIHT